MHTHTRLDARCIESERLSSTRTRNRARVNCDLVFRFIAARRSTSRDAAAVSERRSRIEQFQAESRYLVCYKIISRLESLERDTLPWLSFTLAMFPIGHATSRSSRYV